MLLRLMSWVIVLDIATIKPYSFQCFVFLTDNPSQPVISDGARDVFKTWDDPSCPNVAFVVQLTIVLRFKSEQVCERIMIDGQVSFLINYRSLL
jgi:hypothetical protein